MMSFCVLWQWLVYKAFSCWSWCREIMVIFHPTLHLSHSSSPLVTHARTVFQGISGTTHANHYRPYASHRKQGGKKRICVTLSQGHWRLASGNHVQSWSGWHTVLCTAQLLGQPKDIGNVPHMLTNSNGGLYVSMTKITIKKLISQKAVTLDNFPAMSVVNNLKTHPFYNLWFSCQAPYSITPNTSSFHFEHQQIQGSATWTNQRWVKRWHL